MKNYCLYYRRLTTSHTQTGRTQEHRLASFKVLDHAAALSHWFGSPWKLSTSPSVGRPYLRDEVRIGASDWSGGNAIWTLFSQGGLRPRAWWDQRSVPKVDWCADGEQKGSSPKVNCFTLPNTAKQRLKKRQESTEFVLRSDFSCVFFLIWAECRNKNKCF